MGKRRLRPDSTPSWYRRQGPNRTTRLAFKRHGKALLDDLARRAQRFALHSGRPWKYRHGRDIETSWLKRFLRRCIATIREMAR